MLCGRKVSVCNQSQNAVDHVAFEEGLTLVAALAMPCQLMLIEAQLMQHCGVKISKLMRLFNGVEANFIRAACHHATANAPAGHQYGESQVVVIPTFASGERPNSPLQSTSVSSSKSRRFRSRIRAATG